MSIRGENEISLKINLFQTNKKIELVAKTYPQAVVLSINGISSSAQRVCFWRNNNANCAHC